MPCGEPLFGRQAAQVLFDAIDRLDLGQAFLRDLGRAGLGDIMQFAAGVSPAIGQRHILPGTFEQAVIACIAINLQVAAEAFQNSVSMLAGSSWRIGERHARRVIRRPKACHCGPGPRSIRF